MEVLGSREPDAPSRSDYLLWAGAGLLMALHAARFGDWLIDDAYVSFSYARRAADGMGLVAQPGALPVEGFSNPSWVLLWTLAYLFGTPSPWLIKGVSWALLTAAMVLLDRAMDRSTVPRAARCGVLGYLALSTPFVLWGFSGLENPLYAALLCGALYQTIGILRGPTPRHQAHWSLGLTSILIAWTRPEGVVFAVALLLPPSLRELQRAGPRAAFRHALAQLGVVASGCALYLGFRRAYFGEWLPNTYYAKRVVSAGFGVRWEQLLGNLEAAVRALGGMGCLLIGIATAAAALLLVRRRRWNSVHFTWATLTLAALGSFVVLPADWMQEYRFATPLFALAPASCAVVVSSAARLPNALGADRRRELAWWLTALLVAWAAHEFVPRSEAAATRLDVPAEAVRARGRQLRVLARIFGVERASALLPDVGGILYDDAVEVVDLGGLVDPTIARTLRTRADNRRFRDYVLDERRPTFLSMHGYWRRSCRLEEDPRLERDYVLVAAHAGRFGAVFYVRRELATEQRLGAAWAVFARSSP